LVFLAVLLVLVVVTVAAVRTVTGPGVDDDAAVRGSLAFLRSSLDGGGAEAAQGQFPEGYFFSYALYGLAWTDLAGAGRVDRAEARAEAGWALDHLTSPAGRAPFTGEGSAAAPLSPDYGIFYAGWTLLLRAGVIALETPAAGGPDAPPSPRRAALADGAEAVAGAFTAALDGGRSPFLAAYPGQSWPVDSVVAVAALRAADGVTGADHAALVRRWVDRAGSLADPRTGLLPHRTDVSSGRALEGSRGTSQSVIQRFWPLVDPVGAPASYARFRERFVTTQWGFVGVREYPPGVEGPGDVDSGPLVAGLSGSATAVAIGAATVNGDRALAATLVHEADLAGVPLDLGGGRRYALGLLPMGDAFVTWARSAPAALVAVGPRPAPVRAWWPAYLLGAWLIALLGWRRTRRRRARRARRSSAAPV
jgi:hypothetical protein